MRVDHAGDGETRWSVFKRIASWTGRSVVADDVTVEPCEGGFRIESVALRAHALVAEESDVAAEIAHVAATAGA